MKRRALIVAPVVLAVSAAAGSSYAQGKDTAPGQLRKTPRATPTSVGPGGVVFGTATPTPTPLGEWTATPSSTASATHTLTSSPAPTKTPTATPAPSPTLAGVYPYHQL